MKVQRLTPFQDLVDHALEDRQGLPVLAQNERASALCGDITRTTADWTAPGRFRFIA